MQEMAMVIDRRRMMRAQGRTLELKE
jgi:hypothetical protein